jgi:predicted DNA-binding transcriptional regulator AlpA
MASTFTRMPPTDERTAGRRMIRRSPEPEDRPPPNPPARHHHLDRRAIDLAQEGTAAGEADDLLNTAEVSEWLAISTQWLEIGRSKGYGPKYIRVTPRRVRYRRADVVAWLMERQHQGTAEYLRRRSAGTPADAA